AVFITGNASTTIIKNGGVQIVNYEGTANSTTIENGGEQIVYYKGKAENTTIRKGGKLDVRDGGKATGVKQDDGAALIATTRADTVVNGTNTLRDFSIENGQADKVLLENGSPRRRTVILTSPMP
ncbi:hypothetical protein C2D16_24400, partial [Escherichia coli]|nr:hypothetical protein [Escherichia coli]